MSLAILCSGQSGQNRGMLDQFLAAAEFEELRDCASTVLGKDVGHWWRGLDEADIFANTNAQFSIALYQIAVWQRLTANLPDPPAAVAGYSLGEVIAWHVAGAIGPADVLRLVLERARLMDACLPPAQAGESCMALWRARATPMMRKALEEAMRRHGVDIAIHRPGGHLVVGAPSMAMDAFEHDPAVTDSGLKRLLVSVPSHTHWLAPASGPLRETVQALEPHDPRTPVVAGIDGSVQRRGGDAAVSLSRQLAQPIRWDWCLETLGSLGVTVAIELGPGNDLSVQLESELPGAAGRAAHEFAAPQDLVDWVTRHTRDR